VEELDRDIERLADTLRSLGVKPTYGSVREERFVIALPYDPDSGRPIEVGFGSSAAVFFDRLMEAAPDFMRHRRADRDDYTVFFEVVLFMLVDLIFFVFGTSWSIQARVFRSPFGDHEKYEPLAGGPTGQQFGWSEAVAAFADVELFHVGFPDLAWSRMGDQLMLPPGGSMRWERTNETSGIVHLWNAEIDVQMELSWHGWTPSLGDYAALVNEERAGNGVDFDFEFRAYLARSVPKDIETMYREWIDCVFERVASRFDWQRIEPI
jgi:hypothetical protein